MPKRNEMKIRFPTQMKLIAKFSLLPACVIFGAAWFLTDNIPMALATSLATAFMGWTNSIILSSLNFIRSEASKGRDMTAQYIEKMFDEMDDLFRDRLLKENKLETILTARVSILELRLSHLEKRTKLQLLHVDSLARLRSDPLDFMKSSEYQQQLTDLKFKYLNEVEQQYSNWLGDKS